MNLRHFMLLAVVGLLPGCVKNGSSVELVEFCAYPDGGTDCAPTATCEKFITGIDRFYINAGSTSLGYYTEVLNQLSSSASSDGATDAHGAYVTGAKLTYSVDVSDSAATEAFSLDDEESGTIESLVPSNGGTATPWLTLLTPARIADLQSHIAANDQVLLTVGVSGKIRLADQSTYTTAPIKYWVWIDSSAFGGYVCPKATDVVTGYCGVYGDAAVTLKCESPTVSTYTIGGTVTGQTGAFTLSCVSTTTETVAVTATTASFQCATAVPEGTGFTVSIATQPAGQTCVIAEGSGAGGASVSGTVGTSNVTDLHVTCTP